MAFRPAASVLLALTALSHPALAQTATPKASASKQSTPKQSPADAVAAVLEDDARAHAPSLGIEGVFDRVRLAYEVSGRAVHGIELARLLVKANDPIRAVGVYRAVATTPLDATPPAGEVEAVEQAKSELANLLLTIPRVTLDVTPRSTSGLKLTIDGRPAPPFVPIMVRPGEHTVDAVANGFEEKRVALTVADRDRKHVPVALESSEEEEEEATTTAAAAPSSAPAAVALPLLRGPRPEPTAGDSSRASPRGASQRTLGWIFVGWGAAALIGGGVATYLAHEHPGDKKELLNTLSIVGYGAGSGLVILGVTVVLTAPSGTYQSASASPSVTRFIPSLATVTGAF